MYLVSLTCLLMALIMLSLFAPALWQGFAILLVVALLSMDSHGKPPME
jgi:hypothetical protein